MGLKREKRKGKEMSDSDFRMDVHCTDACMNPLALADTHWASLTTPVEGTNYQAIRLTLAQKNT